MIIDTIYHSPNLAYPIEYKIYKLEIDQNSSWTGMRVITISS